MSYLFALGFISILGQVVLLRELSVASYGVELIYTIALGIWLLSTGCGTLLLPKTPTSFDRINLLFVLFSASLPLDIAFIRSVRLLFSNLPGAYMPLHLQLVAICASLLPVGLILGLLFRWTAKAYIAEGNSLAAAYAIESVGGVAGGLCSTLLLKLGYQNFVIGLICALIALGSSLLAFDGRIARRLRIISLAMLVSLLAFAWKAPILDRFMTSWTHPNLVETRDSPYSRITVTYRDRQVAVFENDGLLFETEGTHAEEFVHLAALQHPDPRRVLILGGGIEGILREILMYSPLKVDYVELNPVLLQAVPQHLPSEIQKSLRAENVRTIVSDPRQFLKRALSYDLILVGMPEPTSAQANRFYTREFFSLCAARLNPGGVMAFSLHSSENFWTPQLSRRMVSIYLAARSVFTQVIFVPGSTNVVIGSMNPLAKDSQILAARLEASGIKTRVISAGYLHYLYSNDRFAAVARTLESGTAPVNSDARPICYQYTIMIWLSKFLPAAKLWDFSAPDFGNRKSVAWLLALSLPALWLSHARWQVRRALLVGVAGFAGMTLETITILHFQTKSGILYQDIGLLLTGFMAGLALGAIGTSKLHRRLGKMTGTALLVGFVALSGALVWILQSGIQTGLVTCLGILALAGSLVAGIFAYAGLRDEDKQADAVTPLYSADLIGGCIGSILTSLILAPVLGLATASLLMIPVLMFSALLL
jgi:spermidine synthase